MDNNALGSKSAKVDWIPRIKELTESKVVGAVFYSDGGQRSIHFKARAGYGLNVCF